MKNHIEEQESITERNCTTSGSESSTLMGLDNINEQTISINLDDANVAELILNANGKQIVHIADIDFDFSKDIKFIISDSNLIMNMPIIQSSRNA